MAKVEISTILKGIKEQLIDKKETEIEEAMEQSNITAVEESERNFAFNMEKLADATTLKKLDEKYTKSFIEYYTYLNTNEPTPFILTYASLLKRGGENFINLPFEIQDYLTYVMIPIPLNQYENLSAILNSNLVQTLYNAKSLPKEVENAMIDKIFGALDYGDTIPKTKIESWKNLITKSQIIKETSKTK